MEAFITAGELKNWKYCRRVVFYRRLMPQASRETYKMREALSAQDLIEQSEVRRSLVEYGLIDFERRFGLWLSDSALALSGKPDLILVGSSEAAVVDFKMTAGEPGDNHVIQLSAYALLVQSKLRLPVRRMFLLRIPDNRVFSLEMTEERRRDVLEALREIRGMHAAEELPEATDCRARCKDCEYLHFCADVY